MDASLPGRTRVIAAVLAILAGCVLALVAVTTIFEALWSGSHYHGELRIDSQRVPFQPGTWTGENEEPRYSHIEISSSEPLIASRAASTVADVLHQGVLIAMAVLLIAIAVSLLAHRPFTRVLRTGLIVLGALIIVSGAIAPQLDALAAGLAAQELGYPTLVIDGFDDGEPLPTEYALVTFGSWTWILLQIDAVLTSIGVALVFVGILIGEGIRLQRDTEGLV
jgi:hypothetical protein